MKPSDPVVPPFPTFRRLPVLASLLSLANTDTNKSIQDMLKTTGIRDIVKTEMSRWEDEARKQMAVILGYPECVLKSGSGGEPHPVHCWTAWFLCKHCTDQAKSKTAIKPLRFKEACQHECPVRKRQKHKNDPWDASNFVRDEKASVLSLFQSPIADTICRQLQLWRSVLAFMSTMPPIPC